MAEDEVRITIATEVDVVSARQAARRLGAEAGFGNGNLTLIATAISELARNIVAYAGWGDIALRLVGAEGRRGIRMVAHDEGPGIPDLELAMTDGYSTGGGLGLGLPGTRRLMDEFEIASTVGEGTTVRVTKWTTR